MFDSHLASRIRDAGLVAVLVVDDAEVAVPLAEALLEGGVAIMELTLRTPVALAAIRRITTEVPEMTVGAGTVLTAEQVGEAADAGAAFAVAPGVHPAVLRAARDRGLSFAPGVMTPTDIETALAFDCRLLKFFPAESSGGLPHLKNIAAPYAHLGIDYLPLGGLNADNMTDYLAFEPVAAIGGSWLAKRDAIRAADWPGIAASARFAVERVRSARERIAR